MCVAGVCRSQSLITTGDIKYLASIAGPGAETVCGEVPAVYTAMAANSTLMAKAKADTLIYLGGIRLPAASPHAVPHIPHGPRHLCTLSSSHSAYVRACAL